MSTDILDSEVLGRGDGPPREVSAEEARRIGGREGMIAAGSMYAIVYFGVVAMIIVQEVFFRRYRTQAVAKRMLEAVVWPLQDRKLAITIFVGAVLTLVFGYVYGRVSGKLILVKSYNSTLTLLATGYAVTMSSLFGMVITITFQEREPLSVAKDILNSLPEILLGAGIMCGIIFLPMLAGAWFFGRRVARRARR